MIVLHSSCFMFILACRSLFSCPFFVYHSFSLLFFFTFIFQPINSALFPSFPLWQVGPFCTLSNSIDLNKVIDLRPGFIPLEYIWVATTFSSTLGAMGLAILYPKLFPPPGSKSTLPSVAQRFFKSFRPFFYTPLKPAYMMHKKVVDLVQGLTRQKLQTKTTYPRRFWAEMFKRKLNDVTCR